MIFAAAFAICTAAPFIERPALTSSDRFAVMITGDGGWRRIDEKVTIELRDNGIPIVGFLASQYFQTRRTPEESACALSDLIRKYRRLWNKDKVILIGFSRGADALPFMINRLPDDVRASIQLVALLGLEPRIDFEYHSPWTLAHYTRHPPQFDVLPEVEKLAGQNVLCVYGDREKDTLCPRLDPSRFKIVREPGGHHFAGRYDEVGKAILDASR
jgi:type IV secretory pathway VirJ component